MSHHSTVPNPALDITDLYAFQTPGDPARSVLILNVYPFAAPPAAAFDSEASYEFKIDTDADSGPDVAFHIMFSPRAGQQQTATVYHARGSAARAMGAAGDVVIHSAPVALSAEGPTAVEGAFRFYAGLRSDPWFADVAGVFNNFQFTGQDTFAAKNVLSIVLEVPNETMSPTPPIRIWARTVGPVHGEWVQVDQVGRPLTTAVFNPAQEEQLAFVRTPPAEQRGRFLAKFEATFRAWGYAEDEASQLALQLLPDVLPYDYTAPGGYPNGRMLTDDMLDRMLGLITRGQVRSDGVGPHADLLADFPYLGVPYLEAPEVGEVAAGSGTTT